MRLLVEVLIIGGLIYLGWGHSFKERADQVRAAVRAATASKPKPAVPQEPATTPAVTATPTPIPLPRVTLAAATSVDLQGYVQTTCC
jgi:hypothetical protein